MKSVTFLLFFCLVFAGRMGVWQGLLFAGAMEDACYLQGMLANGTLLMTDLTEEHKQKTFYMKTRAPSAVLCCRKIGDDLGDVQRYAFEEKIKERDCLKERIPGSAATKVIHVFDPTMVRISNGNRLKLAAVSVTRSQLTNHSKDMTEPALAWLKENVEGKEVFVISHIPEGQGTLHVRLFRDEDGLFINEAMIKQGLAYFSPATSVAGIEDLLTKAEREGMENNRGAWN